MKQKRYDVIGIGIGPFNLGLAALLDPVDEIDALFFDKDPYFEWHPGMLIQGTDLQVPFIADLVTFADPTSPYTFLNYAHTHNRLYSFFFFNRFDIPRQEYNEYAKWVSKQLTSCQFGKRVVDVKDHQGDDAYYEVSVMNVKTEEMATFYAKHLVLGTGSVPLVPEKLEEALNEDLLHTSSYLNRKEDVKRGNVITVVGSGQSAAEVFHDLLKEQDRCGYQLNWLTRSPHFQQLEESKIAQEVFSPDYVNYFHSLSFDERMNTLESLRPLRNGVEKATLQQIYDLLYHRSVTTTDLSVTIQASTEVKSVQSVKDGTYSVSCYQHQTDQTFEMETNKLILATGYKPYVPKWLDNMRDEIVWEDEKRFKVTRDYRIAFKKERNNHLFTLTNLEHSHGAGATNLGLSVQRNQHIINKITGKGVYPIPQNTTFQQFTPNTK
ncbi:SidA/IucD/PvdA family monooxygenase [Bacillus sp. CGMCC 1.16541]|uniref:lysine N(6)-hydroxylase/L-ornithine N(5)-oxygenase family protein n=1 Tax=Bacillus sp. CGMCC 1.16541 TaxID=2185143 RepID=UPI000D73DE85|nr:SidA/IucD/PvdA family monooxygenase [Bacillus sp. CGMCC 1.16541]